MTCEEKYDRDEGGFGETSIWALQLRHTVETSKCKRVAESWILLIWHFDICQFGNVYLKGPHSKAGEDF